MLASLYFFAFNNVVSQIVSRADSDTSNLLNLATKFNSIDKALDAFNSSRDLEVIIVDENYLVLESTTESFKTRYLSSNVIAAKAEGAAYSFIKQDAGESLFLIYSKKGSFNDEEIIINIQYPFLSYLEFKNMFVFFIFLSILIIIVDLYLITSLYVNSYILNLNRAVKTNHIYNDLNNNGLDLSTNSENKEVVKLIETLNTYKNQVNSILESDKKRFSKVNSFLSNIPTGIIVIDTNKEISLINEKAYTLFSINRREVLSPSKTEEMEMLYRLCEKVSKDKKIRIKDASVNNKIIEIEALPMIDKYSPFEFIGVLFLLRDVTKIREVDNIKNDFISNVSHELRTPLTIISGFAQALSSDNISDEDKVICIESINKEASKLSFLIKELLQFSKIDNKTKADNIKRFNPSSVIKDQVALYFYKAKEKNILIQVESENRIDCKLTTNEIYFRQIINNLIDNAIKYSPQNSTITISEKVTDDNYTVSVEDTGFGIDKEDLDKIFDRFYRVEKSRNSEIAGSGLGLSIVKLFLDTIGGTISVESTLGVGSKFTVIIKRNKNA